MGGDNKNLFELMKNNAKLLTDNEQ